MEPSQIARIKNREPRICRIEITLGITTLIAVSQMQSTEFVELQIGDARYTRRSRRGEVWWMQEHGVRSAAKQSAEKSAWLENVWQAYQLLLAIWLSTNTWTPPITAYTYGLAKHKEYYSLLSLEEKILHTWGKIKTVWVMVDSLNLFYPISDILELKHELVSEGLSKIRQLHAIKKQRNDKTTIPAPGQPTRGAGKNKRNTDGSGRARR